MKKIILLSVLSFCSFYAQTIKIQKTSGDIFVVPVTINNIVELPFAIDTGSSESSMPAVVINMLIKYGHIKETEYLTNKIYTFADGKQQSTKRINIKEFIIGGIKVKNIAVSISPSDSAPMLIGQNVLQKLGSITFNYKNNTLIVQR